MATLKVVLDTNVILSGLAYPASTPGKIMGAWRAGAIEVYLSHYILDALRRVLPRLEHRHGLDHEEIDELVDILAFQAELLEPEEPEAGAVRDSNDSLVLGTWLALSALDGDYLVTGDKDLLVLASSYPVVSPGEFWQRHGL